MPISIRILGTTAMAALLTLSGPPAFAQTSTGTGETRTGTNDGVNPVQDALDAARIQNFSTGGQSSEDQSGDGSLEQVMDADEAPATDGVYQMEGGASPNPEGNTPGDIQPPEGDINFGTGSSADGQQAGQSGQAGQSDQMSQSDRADQSRTMMLDLDGFAQQIYERGYRQGYLNGISDGREQAMQAMRRMHGSDQRQERDRLRGEERPQQRGDGNAQQRGDGNAQQRGDSSSQQSSGSPQGSGGSVIVLPPGVSPEAFVEELMRRSQ